MKTFQLGRLFAQYTKTHRAEFGISWCVGAGLTLWFGRNALEIGLVEKLS